MTRLTALLTVSLLAILACTACLWPEFIVRNEYRPPQDKAEDSLEDDLLAHRPALKFDPALIDLRPLGDWLVNGSAAVIRLDVPPLKPDCESDLLRLRASYALAVAAARNVDRDTILPSVNLIDGKVKQFDDGLYAALDDAYYRGLNDRLRSHVTLIKRMHGNLEPNSAAAPFLAAALQLAGVTVEVRNAREKDRLLAVFLANEVRPKPIGFYTWNEKLSACFRFLRFLQHEFSEEELATPLALAQALRKDDALRADYQRAVTFYARLTNPLQCRSLGEIVDCTSVIEVHNALAQGGGPRPLRKSVAVFPGSTCKESVLFEKLFPQGLPPDVNLMGELIQRIRSGEVDLRPGADSGWYDYQVHALETLLLPEKGEEHTKLLLMKAYKKRMLEAFKALLTKRRETHIRQISPLMMASAPPPMSLPPTDVKPRLRVEPCPSYYLRTARAYAFLADFLDVAVGPEALQTLHGLRQQGKRSENLHAELRWMRDLCYGLYLVSAEDIGLKPALEADDPVDLERCYRLAASWLPTAFADADLQADTRIAVPVAYDPVRKVTRVWATLGVRLARLDADYVRPPSLRLAAGGDWEEVAAHRLGKATYLIAVDEFAEVELPYLGSPNREEFRALCDRHQTKDAILACARRNRSRHAQPNSMANPGCPPDVPAATDNTLESAR